MEDRHLIECRLVCHYGIVDGIVASHVEDEHTDVAATTLCIRVDSEVGCEKIPTGRYSFCVANGHICISTCFLDVSTQRSVSQLMYSKLLMLLFPHKLL